MSLYIPSARVSLTTLVALLSLNPIGAQEPVDYGKQIVPILQKNCVACHHRKEAEGGVVLESLSGIRKGGESGPIAIAGKGLESLLVQVISGKKEPVMPPIDNKVGAKQLSENEIETIRRWIDEGAKGTESSGNSGPAWTTISSSLQPIYATAASSDGQFVALGRGNQIKVYQWPNLFGDTKSQTLSDSSIAPILGTESTQAAHLDLVQSLAFSPAGDLLASGGYREIKIWRRQITTDTPLIENLANANCISASPDGKWLAIATEDKMIVVSELASKKVRWRLQGVTDSVHSIAWAPSSSSIGMIDSKSRLAVWQLPNEGEPDRAIDPASHQTLNEQLDQFVLFNDLTVVGRTVQGRLQVYRKATSGGEPDAKSTMTWELLPVLSELSDVVSLASLSSDPIKVAAATKDGAIRILKIPGGETEATWQHGSPLRLIAIAPDGKTMASLGENGSCKFLNIADGKVLSESGTDHRAQRINRDRTRDLARQKAKVERLEKRIPELEKAKKDEEEAKAKQKVTRDKSAETLASKVMEVDKEKVALTESEKVLAAAKLAVEEAMKKVELANKDIAAKQEAIAKAEKVREEAQKEVAKHDQVLAAADEAIARATQAIPKFQMEIDGEKGMVAQLQALSEEAALQLKSSAAPMAVQFSADARSLLSLHADQTIRSIRVQTAKPESIVPLSKPIDLSKQASLSIGPEGRILVATKSQSIQSIQLPGNWILEKTIGNATESPFSDRVTALDFSSDGKQLLVGSGPPSRFGEMKILSTVDWTVAHDFGEAHSDTILTAKFSPDGRFVASGGADKIIRIFETSGKFLRTLEGHTHHVLALAWNDDGQTLASASADATVKIWEAFSGQQQRTISGFGKEVTALGFVGQTQQLLTTSADRQTRLYDASNGKSIRTFESTPDALYSASLIEDGPCVVAGGQDGTLVIWNLENAKAIQTIK